MIVRTSTLVGMTVMDAIESGASVTLYVHGVSDAERERLLGQLVERGLRRDDSPGNGDCRAVVSRDASRRLNVCLWGQR